jgi:hypothetical protein
LIRIAAENPLLWRTNLVEIFVVILCWGQIAVNLVIEEREETIRLLAPY